jgi:hypothetical protein
MIPQFAAKYEKFNMLAAGELLYISLAQQKQSHSALSSRCLPPGPQWLALSIA